MLLRTLALALCLASPAKACETALLLAIDISGSIDAGEYRLQMQGLADALESPDVAAILVADQVSLAVVHWSGIERQKLTLPWRAMTTPADVARFASIARTLPRAFDSSDTAVGYALEFAIAQFAAVPDCRRKVIDISGDGPENAGFNVNRARAGAEAAGIIINAIAIEAAGQSFPLTGFFRNWVITRGGFVMTARGVDDYPRAIQAKLLRELSKIIG